MFLLGLRSEEVQRFEKEYITHVGEVETQTGTLNETSDSTIVYTTFVRIFHKYTDPDISELSYESDRTTSYSIHRVSGLWGSGGLYTPSSEF